MVVEVKEANRDEGEKTNINRKVRPDMIRRMDDEPKRINPSGFAVPLKKVPTAHSTGHPSFAIPTDNSKPVARRNSTGYDTENRE